MDQTSLQESLENLLNKLKTVEIALGNLIDPESEHHKLDVNDLAQSLATREDILEQNEYSEATAEQIFAKIVNLLNHAGWDTAKITATINAYLKPYSRLNYCDEAEVRAAFVQ